jgi:hypothetical protein
MGKSSKTVYHSDLVKWGTVEVTICGVVKRSKYEGMGDYIILDFGNGEAPFNCENEQVSEFFKQFREGDQVVIRGSGSREDAVIEEGNPDDVRPVEQDDRARDEKPRGRQQQQRTGGQQRGGGPRQSAAPAADRKPEQKRNPLNDPLTGFKNIRAYLKQSNVAMEQCCLAVKAFFPAFKKIFGKEPNDEQVRAMLDRYYIGSEKQNLVQYLPLRTPAETPESKQTAKAEAKTDAKAETDTGHDYAPEREDDDVPF